MPIDINLLRSEKGGNPQLVKESQRKRGANVELVDEIIALDKQWTTVRFQLDEINRSINVTQKQISAKYKAKEDATELLAEKAAKEGKKGELISVEKQLNEDKHNKLNLIGNIVESTVVDSLTEDENNTIRIWPEGEQVEKNENLMFHHEVLAKLKGYEPERGSRVSGHRGYFLRNWGVRLNQALINYGMDFLIKRNYTLLQTPFMMNCDVMAKTAQLSQFDEELYKVTGDDEKYLIATSEQPISAFHMGEVIEPKDLPLKYGGYSTCFRKEAGAYGKDTWGIFRVHQFEKIEQFVFTDPEKSWEMFDEMIGTAEAFYQSLGLSYRVIGIVSGALNNAAAKKYDLEAWFPRYGEYKELVSCSNCTDYQSRHLDIKFGNPKMGDHSRQFVHCLNATLCATERTLCCLLENYQRPSGLEVPEKLRPYLGGIEFIPYE